MYSNYSSVFQYVIISFNFVISQLWIEFNAKLKQLRIMISHIFFEDRTKVITPSEINWILNSLVHVLFCRNVWIRHEFSNLIVSNSIFVCKGPSLYYVIKRAGWVESENGHFCWRSVMYLCWLSSWVGQKKYKNMQT